MAQERYFIGPGLRDKLRETITRVDGMIDRERGVNVPTALQELPRRASGGEPRLGTISATWDKGEEATVTQIKADGTALSPTVTFLAKNHFATVTVNSGTKRVLCVFVGDRWLLVAAEC